MEPQAPRGGFGPVVVIAAAVALGAVAFAMNRTRVPAPVPAPAPTVAVVPEVAPDAAAVPAAAPEPASGVAPAAAAPTFDVVRVAPDGAAVVAGTAAPGAEVTVYAGDDAVATATADADGGFVAMFDAEPTAEPRALTLGDGTRRSDETVMLLPKAPEVAPAQAASAPGAAPEAAEPAEIAATAIVRADSVEVLPAPGSGGRVVLGSVSYAEAGEVTLAGVGTAGAVVRAYVDGRLAREATVGGDGRWSFPLDDVAAGLYTLRIDQLAPDGKVASRIETPFQRDFPRAPLPRPGDPAATSAGVPAGGAIIVQPGNNLWTLAREHYGSGMHYTQIFTANRALIADPDRIYPGQIFTMPGLDGPPPARIE